MPITSSVFTLSSATAIMIVQSDNMPQHVHLHNMTKSSNEYVHVGPSSVTINNSIHIDPGEDLQLVLMPNDTLWAVSDPDGLEVGVLTITKEN